MDLGLEGKVALVTAASRGLGRAVATELAREGARVIISSRDEEALSSTATEIEKETNAEVTYFPADLSAEGDIRALVSHVAERFHLIKNLGDAVLRVFQRRAECLRSIPAPGPPHLQLTRLRLDREVSREHTRAQMRSLFRSIQALRRAGMNKSAIARFLGVHRHTVQKYSALESAPQRKPRTHKVSALAPYESYILKRFADGCRNATQIDKEISEQGYQGAYNNVARITQ